MTFQIVSPSRAGGSTSLTHNSGETTPCASSSQLADEPSFALDEVPTIAVTGEPIASSHAYMRGHGSFLSAPSIHSSVCGPILRVNKLISVKPIRTRYVPEVGDLVVGRIAEVGPKRWKVDTASRSESTLSLASINLPGGVQRRKLESDELQMRTFFQEGDLLVAEVQGVFNDGSVGLHTRSLRYGKLRNGALVKVPPTLVRRLKSHFVHLKGADVDLVLGLNGYVWVAKHIPFDVSKVDGGQGLAGSGVGMDIDGVYSDTNEQIDASTRRAISKVCEILQVLAEESIPISDESIEIAYDIVAEGDIEPQVREVLVESLLAQ